MVKAWHEREPGFEEVTSGRIGSLAEISRRGRLRKRYVARLTKLAFTALSIAEAIVEGRAAIGVNLQMLMDGRLQLRGLSQPAILQVVLLPCILTA